MYILKISGTTHNDLAKSSEWYNEQKGGLGKAFLKEVFSTFNLVTENPLHYSIRFSGRFHFAKVSRFPFLIVYEVFENSVIINGVFHTSRNPIGF